MIVKPYFGGFKCVHSQKYFSKDGWLYCYLDIRPGSCWKQGRVWLYSKHWLWDQRVCLQLQHSFPNTDNFTLITWCYRNRLILLLQQSEILTGFFPSFSQNGQQFSASNDVTNHWLLIIFFLLWIITNTILSIYILCLLFV